MGKEPKQAAAAPATDVPRVEDEPRLVPKLELGGGAAPPVVIEQHVVQPPQRTASERAYDGPGLSAVIDLLRMPNPSHIAIALAMVEHPSERDAILAELRKYGDDRLVELVLKVESEQRAAANKPVQIGTGGPQIGDTKVYPAPAFSTDRQHDSYVDGEAARERRELERAAQRHGDKPHDPIGDKLRGKDPPTQSERNAERKADEAIEDARRQLAPDAGVYH